MRRSEQPLVERGITLMVRLNGLNWGDALLPELNRDGEDQLLLIDDADFVRAFAEAASRQGDNVICVQCGDPNRSVRAVIVMIESESTDEAAGSVGFCSDCYRDLAELIRHGALLRASKSIYS